MVTKLIKNTNKHNKEEDIKNDLRDMPCQQKKLS